MASYGAPMTDDEILASGISGKRSYVMPDPLLDKPVEDLVSEDPLMESMGAEPAYKIGQPKVESLIVQDKIARDSSPDDDGFWNQFYGSLESTIFQSNPRLSGRAIEGLGRVSGIDVVTELGQNIVTEFDSSPPEEKFTPRISTYKDVDGLNELLDYVGFGLGQGLGSMGMTIGGVVVGGGLAAAGGAAVGAYAGGVGAIPAGAAAAVAGGATGGAIAGSFLLNYGDMYDYLVEQEGMDEDTAANWALIPGTAMAGLDAYGLSRLAGPLRQKLSQDLAKRTAQLALQGGGIEGITEASQQIIQETAGELAETLGYSTEDIEFSQRWENIVNGGIIGLLTGGTVGGASASVVKPTPTPAPGPTPGPTPTPGPGPAPTPVESAFTDDNIDVVTEVARPGFAYFTHSIGGGMMGRRMGLMGGLDTLGGGIADAGVLFDTRDTDLGPSFRPFLHQLGFISEGDADGRSVADNLRKKLADRTPYLHDASVSFLYELPIAPDADVQYQTVEMDGKTSVNMAGANKVIADASMRLGEPGTEAASTIAERILANRGVSRGRGLNSVLPSKYIRGVFVSGEFISLDDYRSRVQSRSGAPAAVEAAPVEEVLEAPEVESVAPFTSRADWEMELSEVMSDPDSEYHIHTGGASAADFLSEGLRLKAGRGNFRGPGETLDRTLDEIISEGSFRATAWNMLGGPEAVKKAYSGGIVNISESLEQGVVGSARGNTVVFKLPKGKTLGDVAEAIPGVDLARVKKNPKQTVPIARIPPKYMVAFIDRNTGELTKYKAPVEAAPEAQGFDTIEDYQAQLEVESLKVEEPAPEAVEEVEVEPAPPEGPVPVFESQAKKFIDGLPDKLSVQGLEGILGRKRHPKGGQVAKYTQDVKDKDTGKIIHKKGDKKLTKPKDPSVEPEEIIYPEFTYKNIVAGEWEALNLDDFIDAAKASGKKSISKEDLVRYVEENKVEVEDVMLGGKSQALYPERLERAQMDLTDAHAGVERPYQELTDKVSFPWDDFSTGHRTTMFHQMKNDPFRVYDLVDSAIRDTAYNIKERSLRILNDFAGGPNAAAPPFDRMSLAARGPFIW